MQDLPGSLSAEGVGVALDLSSISSRQHRIKLIATQAPSNLHHLHVSVVEAEQAMYALSQVWIDLTLVWYCVYYFWWRCYVLLEIKFLLRELVQV